MNVTRVTADTAVATLASGQAPGRLHTISIAPTTATPTAGLLTVYDNTAESGTVIYTEWVFATAVGHTIMLDCNYYVGLYVGFDATLASVSCSVTYQ